MAPENKYEQALDLYERRQYQEAFIMFERLAEKGHGDACSLLAVMYGAGHGVEYDFEKSRAWDLRAIELGQTTSIFNLAVSYRSRGDAREARKWFETAAANNDGEAMLELAKLIYVSDFELTLVIQLLESAMNCSHISQDGREEAESLLGQIRNRV